MLTFSTFQTFSNAISKSHCFNTNISVFVHPPNTDFLRTLKKSKDIGLTFIITAVNDSLLFNPFQSSVVFHTEIVIWFALQIRPGSYMERYTELRWDKRECSLPQILKLESAKMFLRKFC